MARRCELTGRSVQSGNNVSHAKNRTRRRFLPNLCKITLHSDALGQNYKIRVSAQALRTVEHRGGFDGFLAKSKNSELSGRVLKIKKLVNKKLAAAAAS